MGYEPISSEFGDIFYDLGKHVQDACKDEITKSNIFVLIVGNNYGSLYHRPGDKSAIPDSVTLQEFRKALEVGIPKYIFLNRFVQHDFENYRRVLSKQLIKHFSEKNIEPSDVEKTTTLIKERFDSTYPFPQDAYRYVFYFLDIIYSLDINNAVFPFESFEDIRETLKKQWAGFFYDALTKQRTIAIEKVELLGKRLDKIEQHLRLLAESSSSSQDKNKLTIDIKSLASDINLTDLEQIQDKINSVISEIINGYDDFGNYTPRFTLKKEVTSHTASLWLSHLNELIQNYKWSKFIPIKEILSGFQFSWWTAHADVPYKVLFELCSIFNSLSESDQEPFLNTVTLRLNEFYSPDQEGPTDLEPF
jgi:hypothetical protein